MKMMSKGDTSAAEKDAPKDSSDAAPKSAQAQEKSYAVHPFVLALRSVGAKIGNDIGMLALQAIGAHLNGPHAVMYWPALPGSLALPEPIIAGMPPELAERLRHVFIVPKGAVMPPLSDVMNGFELIQRDLADGAIMLAFLSAQKNTETPAE
jgi:hypothetical protein